MNQLVGNNIPPDYVSAIEKGFQEAANAGVLIGHPVVGVRVRLQDGAAHAVDSSEMAFRIAAQYAFRSFFPKAKPQVLEPIMKVEVEVPSEFQGSAVAGIGRRRGLILSSDTDSRSCVVKAEVPLSSMFGYSTDLRSSTEGKGEFSMDYLKHQPVQRETQKELIAAYLKKRAEGHK